MHNTDKLYLPNEIDLVKVVEFSEGCVELYDVLKYCLDNKIKTYACCKGHRYKNTDNQNTMVVQSPYISFIVDTSSQDRLSYLINDVLKDNHVRCSLSKINDNMVLSIYYDYLNDGMDRSLFELILHSFQKYDLEKGKNIDTPYNNIFKFLNIISEKDMDINFQRGWMSIQAYEPKIFTHNEDPTIPEGQYINARVPKKNFVFKSTNEILNNDIYNQILQSDFTFFVAFHDVKVFLDRFFELKDNRHIK